MKLAPVALLALFVFAFSPVPAGAYDACETIPGGHRACGTAALVGCSTGVGEGEATRSVFWELKVVTNHGNAYDSTNGHVAALAADAPCWTDTCARVELYADGVLIHKTLTQCIQL